MFLSWAGLLSTEHNASFLANIAYRWLCGVRHFDNGNPHCHLVYNRINNEGKTITDQNDFRRNEQVTKLLKQKYGLTSSKGKYKTKTERLRGCEKTKYEIHHLVMSAASESI